MTQELTNRTDVKLLEGSTTSLETTSTSCPLRYIVRIFQRFADRYNSAWNFNKKTEKEKKLIENEWCFELSGITPEAIRDAINDLGKDHPTFPPNAFEFRILCEKKMGIDFPDDETAYQMAIAKDFSNIAVRMAFDKIGSWDMAHKTERELRIMFSREYKLCISTVRGAVAKNVDLRSLMLYPLPSYTLGGEVFSNEEIEGNKLISSDTAREFSSSERSQEEKCSFYEQMRRESEKYGYEIINRLNPGFVTEHKCSNLGCNEIGTICPGLGGGWYCSEHYTRR